MNYEFMSFQDSELNDLRFDLLASWVYRDRPCFSLASFPSFPSSSFRNDPTTQRKIISCVCAFFVQSVASHLSITVLPAGMGSPMASVIYIYMYIYIHEFKRARARSFVRNTLPFICNQMKIHKLCKKSFRLYFHVILLFIDRNETFQLNVDEC